MSTRTLVSTLLGSLLVMGSLVVSAAPAHAAAPELRMPLAAGIDIRGPLVATGSTVVMGSHRSTDFGATWTTDPVLASMQSTGIWRTATGGTLIGYDNSVGKAVVYSVASGAAQTYPLDSHLSGEMNQTWGIGYEDSTLDSVVNFVTSESFTVPVPSDPSLLSRSLVELSPSSALLWSSSIGTGTPVFSVSTSPHATPSAWLSIPGVEVYSLTDTAFVYVVRSGYQTSVCSRPWAAFTAAATCSVLMSDDLHCNAPTIDGYGTYLVVRLPQCSQSKSDGYFLVNGSTVVPILVPSGSTTSRLAPAIVNGDWAYILLVDTASNVSVKKVSSDGSLTAGPNLPRGGSADLVGLAVTPGRIAGSDSRDGVGAPASWWTRSVNGSSFGTETTVTAEARSLAASSTRTAVQSSSTLSVYDGNQLSGSFSTGGLSQISGPYVSQVLYDTYNSPHTDVSTVDGTRIASFPDKLVANDGVLFGSHFVTVAKDADPNGSLHLTIHDLTGKAQDRVVDLAAGSARCGYPKVWGDYFATACSVYSLVTGKLLYTVSVPNTSITALGDGYVLINSIGMDPYVSDFAGNWTSLSGCIDYPATDGVGHVACASSSEIIWRDFSSLSTSPGRVLGWLAPTSFSSGTWSPQIDVTKAFSAGVLRIKKGNVVVRELPVPASTTGSVRGVSWDGRNTAGAVAGWGSYTAELVVSATDSSGTVTSIDGTTPSFDLTWDPAPTTPGAMAPVSPSRILDTRVTGGKLAAAESRSLKVTGQGGVPSTGVAAVVLNVTVTETTSGGYLTVSPTGTARPTVSNLNWGAGATIPNAVTVKVGTGGKVDLYQSGPGTAQVIVDVAGYYVDGVVTEPGAFTALTPTRILDSRSDGGKFAALESRDVQITDAHGVPSSVSAVVLNITVTETTAPGYLTAYPSGTTRPLASNLNWVGGSTIPNLVTVKVGSNGKVSLFQSGGGTAQVVADLAGYYLAGTPTVSGMFVAVAPARVLDTRSTGPVAAHGDKRLVPGGQGGIPDSGVSAVVLNTTVTETTAPGYLTVYPGTITRPTASNLNWARSGTTIPNLVTVRLGEDGSIDFYNGSSGTTQVVADTAGYYIA